MKKIKIMFVCTGNICRSPLAHAYFEDLVKKKKLSDKIEVDSSGTHSHIGELPDRRARKIGEKYNLDVNHLARDFSLDDWSTFDLILVMDQFNFNYIIQKRFTSMDVSKIKFLREFDPNIDIKDIKKEQKQLTVPDPYYGGIEEFEQAYKIISRCCDQLIEYMEKFYLKQKV